MIGNVRPVRSRLRTGVMIDGEKLEEVSEYNGLGRLVTSGNDISKETAQRITSGWRRFGEYSHFLKDRRIPIWLKRTIMDTVILPAMTYGAETCALTIHQEKKLAVAQRSMERWLLNIMKRDKIRNEIIRCKTGVKDVIERVRCMRGQWAGHVARMTNTRWAKITSEWTPREGKRVRGRSKKGGETTSRKLVAVNGWEWLKIEVHGVSCGGHLPAVVWTAEMIMMNVRQVKSAGRTLATLNSSLFTTCLVCKWAVRHKLALYCCIHRFIFIVSYWSLGDRQA